MNAQRNLVLVLSCTRDNVLSAPTHVHLCCAAEIRKRIIATERLLWLAPICCELRCSMPCTAANCTCSRLFCVCERERECARKKRRRNSLLFMLSRLTMPKKMPISGHYDPIIYYYRIEITFRFRVICWRRWWWWNVLSFRTISIKNAFMQKKYTRRIWSDSRCIWLVYYQIASIVPKS